jgi:hypothetical protein
MREPAVSRWFDQAARHRRTRRTLPRRQRSWRRRQRSGVSLRRVEKLPPRPKMASRGRPSALGVSPWLP